jgi:hypothetical protein
MSGGFLKFLIKYARVKRMQMVLIITGKAMPHLRIIIAMVNKLRPTTNVVDAGSVLWRTLVCRAARHLTLMQKGGKLTFAAFAQLCATVYESGHSLRIAATVMFWS